MKSSYNIRSLHKRNYLLHLIGSNLPEFFYCWTSDAFMTFAPTFLLYIPLALPVSYVSTMKVLTIKEIRRFFRASDQRLPHHFVRRE